MGTETSPKGLASVPLFSLSFNPMKRLFFIFILSAITSLNTYAQWLYKVSGDSLPASSYIVAAHSLLNPMGITSKISNLPTAINETEQMAFVVHSSPYKSEIESASKLPAGKTLASLLTPAQVKLLDAFLKKYTEVGWNSSYSQKRYNNKYPLAVLQELQKLLFVSHHIGEYDPTHSFDDYFEAQAQHNGEPVYGLIDINVALKKFTDCPLDEQVKDLVSFLENEQAMITKMDKTVEAYEQKDMDAVAANSLSDDKGQEVAQWTKKMQERMKQKATLFVLPCEKLGGTNGVIQQLRSLGYAVEGLE